MDSTSIEGYLIRSGISYDTLGEGMWVVHDDIDHVDNIVVTHSPPLLMFRVKLMDLPRDEGKHLGLFKMLLELNASEMISGAYAVENGAVVALETLQAENLDLNEFQAAIDGLTLAITDHYEELKQFHTAGESAGN